jgi:hypothetical protein
MRLTEFWSEPVMPRVARIISRSQSARARRDQCGASQYVSMRLEVIEKLGLAQALPSVFRSRGLGYLRSRSPDCNRGAQTSRTGAVARTPSLRRGKRTLIGVPQVSAAFATERCRRRCHSKQFFIGASKEPIVRSISCIDPGDKGFIEFVTSIVRQHLWSVECSSQ